ncbi:hypothetical protein Syun_022743 [Stephania yunnanensis]|uniref:Uncharacterized protein n=1 Tax=Stephania yunnanensis TaxID=152371 RepID=A0AAP0FA87_9MAGN
MKFLLTNIALKITDIIDTKDLHSRPVKIVKLERHSPNHSHSYRRPLSLQDLSSFILYEALICLVCDGTGNRGNYNRKRKRNS